MKWFRSRIKAGTRLALLALAVQFVPSFGHVHGAAALAAPGLHTAAAPAAALLPDQVKSAADAVIAGAPAQKPDRSSGDHHDGYCAICAVMSLAGTLIASGPVILMVPEAYQILSRTTDAEFSHLGAPHGISQPRAPPAS
ncbi:MAG: DUF2946 family protein [Xanthobacteraceae bacterium]|nr:DUF2946 family protein [Xanthobacteraceae bacterium]